MKGEGPGGCYDMIWHDDVLASLKNRNIFVGDKAYKILELASTAGQSEGESTKCVCERHTSSTAMQGKNSSFLYK